MSLKSHPLSRLLPLALNALRAVLELLAAYVILRIVLLGLGPPL